MCCGGHQQGFRLQTESVFLSFNMPKKTKLDSQHIIHDVCDVATEC